MISSELFLANLAGGWKSPVIVQESGITLGVTSNGSPHRWNGLTVTPEEYLHELRSLEGYDHSPYALGWELLTIRALWHPRIPGVEQRSAGDCP